jgi:hypothetical protein
MFGRGELAHIDSDLRQQSLRDPLADPGNLINDLLAGFPPLLLGWEVQVGSGGALFPHSLV